MWYHILTDGCIWWYHCWTWCCCTAQPFLQNWTSAGVILLWRNPFCTDHFRYRICWCRNPDVLCMASDPVRYLRTWWHCIEIRLRRYMGVRFSWAFTASIWSASRILPAVLADRCGRNTGSRWKTHRRRTEHFLCTVIWSDCGSLCSVRNQIYVR